MPFDELPTHEDLQKFVLSEMSKCLYEPLTHFRMLCGEAYILSVIEQFKLHDEAVESSGFIDISQD